MTLTYEDVKHIAEKPLAQREEVIIDGKKVLVRKYHLKPEEIQKFRDEQKTTGKFPNPYKRQGPYRAIIQALIDLGVDQWHSFATMRNRMREIMQNMILNNGKSVWDTFSTRETRNSISGKDLTGKILQNALIMQRINGLHRYGDKLKDLCASIDAKRENGVIYFRLNTTWTKAEDVKPFNQM